MNHLVIYHISQLLDDVFLNMLQDKVTFCTFVKTNKIELY